MRMVQGFDLFKEERVRILRMRTMNHSDFQTVKTRYTGHTIDKMADCKV